ncbi:cyclic GMP-AMP synthase-like receptor isoform X2 [Leptinotarsa decemlineata]|uniref:cyclic GMP-AMP synthase-like receptor isoform X2 n=1 Tax=Leptinotarsa decemlineata TaxID=7539 RepID=UPI003D306D47
MQFSMRENIGHGGICIFARNDLNLKLKGIDLSEFCLEQTAEFAGIEILSQKTIIICTYRSSRGQGINAYLKAVDNVLAHVAGDKQLLDTILEKMRQKNPLFNMLTPKKYYGGSYWDGVKVTKPDEYDVHIQLRLDKVYKKPLEPSNEPGWVNLKMERSENPGLHCLVSHDDYLDTEKVMLWIHQILSCSLGGYKKGKKRYCSVDTPSHGSFKLSFRRHGPAFTFHARGTVHKQTVDINLDFVPCFLFPGSQYPTCGFLMNPVPRKPDIFIVSKPVKTNNKGTRYWRVSFQEQERYLINGKEKLKPVLRLLKKMRDKLRHDSIASYFIKNIFLCEIQKQPPEFWNQPLSYVFMKMLKIYQKQIEDKTIPFYWYESDNLISHVDPAVLNNINKKLVEIIIKLERRPSIPKVVGKCFLTRRELRAFLLNFKPKSTT